MSERTLALVWREDESRFMRLLLVLMTAFILLMLAGFLTVTPSPRDSTPSGLVMLLVMGGGYAYTTAAVLLNRTVLILGADQLSLKRGPIPWFGARAVMRRDISTVGVKRHEWRDGTHYSVAADLEDGTRVTIIHRTTSVPAGRIADEIAAWLDETSDQNKSTSPSETGASRH